MLMLYVILICMTSMRMYMVRSGAIHDVNGVYDLDEINDAGDVGDVGPVYDDVKKNSKNLGRARNVHDTTRLSDLHRNLARIWPVHFAWENG